MFDIEIFICEIEQRAPLYNIQAKEHSNREIKAKCWTEIGEVMYADWSVITTAVKDMRVKELMKKWKAIRDNFVKDHRLAVLTETGKEATKKKRYVYYDQLQFLLPAIRGNKTTSNIESLGTIDDDAEQPNALKEPSAAGDADLSKITSEPVAGTSTQVSDSTTAGSLKRKRETEHTAANKNKKAGMKGTVASSVTKDLTSILSESLALQKQEREADIYGHKAFMMSFVPIMNTLPFHTAMRARLQIAQVINDLACNSSGNGTPSSCTTATTPTGPHTDSSEDFNISDYLHLK